MYKKEKKEMIFQIMCIVQSEIKGKKYSLYRHKIIIKYFYILMKYIAVVRLFDNWIIKNKSPLTLDKWTT